MFSDQLAPNQKFLFCCRSKKLKACIMIAVVFLVSFSEIEFSCFQKYVEFFYDNIFLVSCCFRINRCRSTSCWHNRRLDFNNSLPYLIDFAFACFSAIEVSYFQKHVEVFYENHSLWQCCVRIDWRLTRCCLVSGHSKIFCGGSVSRLFFFVIKFFIFPVVFNFFPINYFHLAMVPFLDQY